MEPVSIDLRLEGRAALLPTVAGMDGVNASVDGEALVVHVVAPTLRELQAVLDATLATLNEAESAG
jgi:hypothetical protein